MLARALPRILRPPLVSRVVIPIRSVFRPQIVETIPGQTGDPPPSVLLKHPKDPANFRASASSDAESVIASSTATSSDGGSPPEQPDAPSGRAPEDGSSLPVPARSNQSNTGPLYTPPPFDTHRFVSELERTFPTQTAQSLMRATRALLIDRLGRVRREALTTKDLENQAYLFRAALSELRAEVLTHLRNESTGVRASAFTARKELDRLDGNMKQAIDALKHECVNFVE
jgi:hypothetical protein